MWSSQSKHTGKKRLILVGQKKLPNVTGHGRAWAFVRKGDVSVDTVRRAHVMMMTNVRWGAVSDDIKDIDADLAPETYQTKTRGERHV
jgi:hypothetical protein